MYVGLKKERLRLQPRGSEEAWFMPELKLFFHN